MSGQKAGFQNPALSDFLRRLEPSVADELAALREEIKQLREALCPPKSAILTGPEVERVFAALITQRAGREE